MTVVPLEDVRNAALFGWYDREQRVLPWRDETDPYRILVSEIMLQQTQASRVIPFYDRFITRFPSVEVLASAVLQDVLGRLLKGNGFEVLSAMTAAEAERLVAAGDVKTRQQAAHRLPTGGLVAVHQDGYEQCRLLPAGQVDSPAVRSLVDTSISTCAVRRILMNSAIPALLPPPAGITQALGHSGHPATALSPTETKLFNHSSLDAETLFRRASAPASM